MTNQHTGMQIILYPPFDNGTDFTDIYYRLVWYLNPIHTKIARIIIPYLHTKPLPGTTPDYLDSSIQQITGNLEKVIQYVNYGIADFNQFMDEATDIIVWKCNNQPEESISTGKKAWHLDDRSEREAGENYLWLSGTILADQSMQEESKEKFSLMAEKLKSSKGHIFGTGQNVAQVLDKTYSLDGFTTIICNSLVKNKPALEKIRPAIVTASDPIFHAGCSSYAGIFRQHLIEVMEQYGSYFVFPMRDYGLYAANLPQHLGTKIIGVPALTRNSPNLDLRQDFSVTSTGNILTQLLLPLACTFFDEIHIAGFDGRPLDQNEYFWKHDPASQLNEQMALIRKAHPAFFEIDYDDYYLTHIETTSAWIKEAQNLNKKLINRTITHIPSLIDIQSEYN